MDGHQPGKVQFSSEGEPIGGDIPKSGGRLENAAPTFLVDAWYLGKLEVCISHPVLNALYEFPKDLTKLFNRMSELQLNQKWTKVFLTAAVL